MDQSLAREESFVELFVKTEPALRSFILSQIMNWADMNEILQQTSVILWRKFDQFEPGSDFRKWAFKIARFEVLNYLKRQRRSRLVFSDETVALIAAEIADDEPALEKQRHALAACLGQLKPEQRAILEECYQDKRTVKDIARLHNRSLEGLYKLMQRLRAGLLECVERLLQQDESEYA